MQEIKKRGDRMTFRQCLLLTSEEKGIPITEKQIKICCKLWEHLPQGSNIIQPVPDNSVQFEHKNLRINVYDDRISLFYVDAFSDTHLMPNVPQDYLIDFLKGMCKI